MKKYRVKVAIWLDAEVSDPEYLVDLVNGHPPGVDLMGYGINDGSYSIKTDPVIDGILEIKEVK